MPTVKLDINTGLEYSPTDGLDSLVKLHNFTVGTDGSLYKLPALKNLKGTLRKDYDVQESTTKKIRRPGRLLDIKKFQTSALEEINPLVNGLTPSEFTFKKSNYFKRYVYLTDLSFGVVNVDYEKNVITNQQIKDSASYLDPDEKFKLFGSFEYITEKIIEDPDNGAKYIDLNTGNSEILVNGVYTSARDDGRVYPDESNHILVADYNGNTLIRSTSPVAVFSASYMFKAKEITIPGPFLGFYFMKEPRNMVCSLMEAQEGETPVNLYPTMVIENFISLYYRAREFFEDNDVVLGPVMIGTRMFYYSSRHRSIFPSLQNLYFTTEKDPTSGNNYKIRKYLLPSEEVQGITEFNGDLLLFTPTGIDRWVISDQEDELLLRDPTFKYSFRNRWNGSWVKANKELYFYTDTFSVYVLKSDLTVQTIFSGILPSYRPIADEIEKKDGRDGSFRMAHFKLLGYHFISLGPWLYNMDTKTWSTYTYDGWQLPEENYDSENFPYLWQNDLSKRLIHSGVDDLVCTYCNTCVPLTYKEMDDLLDENSRNTLIDGEYQWGKVAMFTTRMYQQENTFSLDGILAYVRGGTLDRGDKLYLKILRGEDKGEIDEDDETTWGVPASYEPLKTGVLDTKETHHVGQFHWRTNIKCERFRVQVVTNSKKGLVIQSVLANLTMQGESLKQEQAQK